MSLHPKALGSSGVSAGSTGIESRGHFDGEVVHVLSSDCHHNIPLVVWVPNLSAIRRTSDEKYRVIRTNLEIFLRNVSGYQGLKNKTSPP